MSETRNKVVLFDTTQKLPPQTAPVKPGVLNGMKIFFRPADDAGCGGYRCILPAEQLRKLGAEVKWAYSHRLEDYAYYDYFIFQRPLDNLATDIITLRKLKKTVLIELDDNLHNIPTTSPVRNMYTFDKVRPLTASIKAANGLIVSTPELEKVYSKYNPNIIVAPNSIDLTLGYRDWTSTISETNTNSNEISLVWRGGISHLEDLKSLTNVIKPLMEKHPNLKICLYSAYELIDAAIELWDIKEYTDRVVTIKPRNFIEFPKGLAGGDIAFIPLANKHKEFNDCKSELALCEFGAYGVPCVASDFAPYRRFANNEKYGLIAKNPTEFFDKLDLLITDSALRKQYSIAVKERVYSDYNLEINVKNWVEGLKQIREKTK